MNKYVTMPLTEVTFGLAKALGRTPTLPNAPYQQAGNCHLDEHTPDERLFWNPCVDRNHLAEVEAKVFKVTEGPQKFFDWVRIFISVGPMGTDGNPWALWGILTMDTETRARGYLAVLEGEYP